MAVSDVSPPDGMAPAVALCCAALERGQGRLLDLVRDLDPQQLTRVPPGLRNSLATLTVHVAATELRWVFRLQARPGPSVIPDDLRAAYLLDRPQDPLPQPAGETAETLVAKAVQARTLLLAALAPLGQADLTQQVVVGPERTATVRWGLVVLPGHQDLHYGQMQLIRQLLVARDR